MSKHLDPKREYVVGFMFDEDELGVLLIRKNRPVWQRGKMNGIGGQIEDGETSHQAMRREFAEETGIDHDGWGLFCTLRDGRGWLVHFFSAAGDIYKANQVTDEQLVACAVESVDGEKVIPNLRWLIPMALTMRLESVSYFEIQERLPRDREATQGSFIAA